MESFNPSNYVGGEKNVVMMMLDRDRRGSALVLVLLLGSGALLLVVLLLSFSHHNARGQFESHHDRSLRSVLQAAVAASIYEINRHRLDGPFDPDGDGVGALLKGRDGRLGLRLRAPSGRILGRYRTTVEKDGDGRYFLNVVAASPDFEGMGQPQADSNRRMVAARVEVRAVGLKLAGHPLDIVGNPSGEKEDPADLKKRFAVSGGARVEILDPTLTVPAVRISDPVFREAFVTASSRPGITIIGQDPKNPGSPGSGAASITETSASASMSLGSLGRLAEAVDAFVDKELASGSARSLADAAAALGAVKVGDKDLVLTTKDGSPSTYNLGKGTFFLDGDVKLGRGVTVKGEGTLIVDKKKLQLNNGSFLEWEGTVLVSGDKDAELKVVNGSRVVVDGVLLVEGARKKAKFKCEAGAQVQVTGSLLLLVDALDRFMSHARGEVHIKAGAKVGVDGLFLLAGEHIHFKVDKFARLRVNGSLSIQVPSGAKKGIHKFEVGGRSSLQLHYDRDKLDAALVELNELMAKSLFTSAAETPTPVRAVSYWETPARALFDGQQAAVAAGKPVGME